MFSLYLFFISRLDLLFLLICTHTIHFYFNNTKISAFDKNFDKNFLSKADEYILLEIISQIRCSYLIPFWIAVIWKMHNINMQGTKPESSLLCMSDLDYLTHVHLFIHVFSVLLSLIQEEEKKGQPSEVNFDSRRHLLCEDACSLRTPALTYQPPSRFCSVAHFIFTPEAIGSHGH